MPDFSIKSLRGFAIPIALLLIIILLAIGFLAGYRVTRNAKTTLPGGNNSDQSSYLFLLAAKSGTLTKVPNSQDMWVLTLHEPDQNIIWFTDRPKRDAGTKPLSNFIRRWEIIGFTNQDPPNAALSIDPTPNNTDLSHDTFIVSLTSPIYDLDRKTVQFSAKAIDNNSLGERLSTHKQKSDIKFPETFVNPKLFIDDASSGASVQATVTFVSNGTLPTGLPSYALRTAGYEGYNDLSQLNFWPNNITICEEGNNGCNVISGFNGTVTLTADEFTIDPYISNKLGSGHWVNFFGPTCDIKVTKPGSYTLQLWDLYMIAVMNGGIGQIGQEQQLPWGTVSCSPITAQVSQLLPGTSGPTAAASQSVSSSKIIPIPMASNVSPSASPNASSSQQPSLTPANNPVAASTPVPSPNANPSTSASLPASSIPVPTASNQTDSQTSSP